MTPELKALIKIIYTIVNLGYVSYFMWLTVVSKLVTEKMTLKQREKAEETFVLVSAVMLVVWSGYSLFVKFY